MEILLSSLAILVAIVLPLYAIYKHAKRGSKSKTPLITNLCGFFGILVFCSVFFFSQSANAADATAVVVTADGFAKGMGYLSAALAVGFTSIGGGIAVASSASAALGALSENDSIFGKAIVMVGLAEGVALYGLLVAFMIISKL
jgi:V/A-type H+/Na+-transporting ATPase subunit K